MYSSLVKEAKYPESLPQNSKMAKGERASHFFLNFASSRNNELLVNKPKRKTQLILEIILWGQDPIERVRDSIIS